MTRCWQCSQTSWSRKETTSQSKTTAEHHRLCERGPKTCRPQPSQAESQGWKMEVDLGRKLHFPEAVLSTTLRHDIIMWSPGGKKIILVELMVPWEEGCEEAAERKKGKYQQLVQDCRDKGWTTRLMTVEVRCRGFPAQSV